MLVNATTVVHSKRLRLEPYSKHHVPKYHEWMKNPDIQAATASEPLTLEQEFRMQESWRQDNDKLTFIVNLSGLHGDDAMVGDVNMFLSLSEQGNAEPVLMGEIELMIAETTQQGKGYGREALLLFFNYIAQHEQEIVQEYCKLDNATSMSLHNLSAKINQDNNRSLRLFESLGFKRTSEEPSYFGEFELRLNNFGQEWSEATMKKYNVQGYHYTEYAESQNENSQADYTGAQSEEKQLQ